MRILVTGGAGYIGSVCVLALLKHDVDIVVFDNCSTGHIETANMLETIGRGKVKFVRGDLQSLSDVGQLFDNYKFDAVMHFAAFSQVGESVQNPAKYYNNNVLSTINLLNIMLSYNVKKIVFSSTASVYGEPKFIPITEEHPCAPINPYGKGKLFIENILQDYDKAYDLKSVRLRYFNVIGADSENRVGEWHVPETHLVPNILASTLKCSDEFSIFGDDYPTDDGTCVRDYVNVEDLAEAHMLALRYLTNGGKSEVFNIGTNRGNSVKEIFSACEKIVGHKINVSIKSRRSGDPAVLVANNAKAYAILAWMPMHTLEESIKSAYKWCLIQANKSDLN